MDEQHNSKNESEGEKMRVQVSFSHKPTRTNPDYHLLTMLKRRKEEQGIIPKMTMLEATKAFWLPIACLNVETYSPGTREQIFWESLAKLNAQQELLWNIVGKALNLERPQMIVGNSAIFVKNQEEDSSLLESSLEEEINSGLDYDEAGIL